MVSRLRRSPEVRGTTWLLGGLLLVAWALTQLSSGIGGSLAQVGAGLVAASAGIAAVRQSFPLLGEAILGRRVAGRPVDPR